MSQNCWPLSEPPFAHFPWPSHGSVALILDGVAIPELGKRIYQWAGDHPVDAECLYVTTRWEPIAEYSPWLVWLGCPEDPVLEGFLEQGAREEQGYLLVSNATRDDCSRWIRSHLQVERLPGCEELTRIAHPALARAVIGSNLGGFPAGVIRQLILPDCIDEQWHRVEPPAPHGNPAVIEAEPRIASAELLDAFHAFNRRKDALQIWSSLEGPVRKQLGGPRLRNAYPELRRILDKALASGCHSLRDIMQFLLSALAG